MSVLYESSNVAKVQKALNITCMLSAAMSCYTRDGWAWDPARAIEDLEAILAIVRDTQKEDARSVIGNMVERACRAGSKGGR